MNVKNDQLSYTMGDTIFHVVMTSALWIFWTILHKIKKNFLSTAVYEFNVDFETWNHLNFL